MLPAIAALPQPKRTKTAVPINSHIYPKIKIQINMKYSKNMKVVYLELLISYSVIT